MTRPTTLVVAALALLTTASVSAQVRDLQGTWEGVLVGQESAGTITITFSGNALHFEGLKADQRYDATFTVKEGTRPRQLRATITGGGVADSIGKVVLAVFKVENGTLSLAGIDVDAPAALDDAEAFDRNTAFHYRFRKVAPGAKTACAQKAEPTPSPAPWTPLKWPG